MIGKITSEMISRRWALSLLGALGFGAAPTVLRPSNAEAQTAGAAPGRAVGLLWLCRAADRTALSRGACLINS